MIKIIIAEDQRMLRGALGQLLDLEEDIEVIGQASDGVEALQFIERMTPDVCLLDIEMPRKSGLDVAEALRDAGSSCRVIILTTFARPGYFDRAVQAGVYGYLLKDGPIEELAEAIRDVMKGKRRVAQELIFEIRSESNPLSDREREVLRLVAEGKSIKDIAAELHLGSGTVRNYMSETISKLQVKNRIEAINKAQERGWI